MITIVDSAPVQLDLFAQPVSTRISDRQDSGIYNFDALCRGALTCVACAHWKRTHPNHWGECAHKARTGKAVAGWVYDRWTMDYDSCDQAVKR